MHAVAVVQRSPLANELPLQLWSITVAHHPQHQHPQNHLPRHHHHRRHLRPPWGYTRPQGAPVVVTALHK